MDENDKQFLMTVVWLFMRHGRRDRALAVCEALHEAEPHDGTVAATLAELYVADGQLAEAVDVLRDADIPSSLEHAAAVIETRALRLLGRTAEADARWRRHLEARKGAARKWI